MLLNAKFSFDRMAAPTVRHFRPNSFSDAAHVSHLNITWTRTLNVFILRPAKFTSIIMTDFLFLFFSFLCVVFSSLGGVVIVFSCLL